MLYFCIHGAIAGTIKNINIMFYIIESTAERRTRRNNDIKKLFYQLTIDEGMSFMEAYEAVGYQFYISADHVQKILRTINKSRQNAEHYFPEKL